MRTEDQKMTLLAKGFKSLGRAGNQNPEMMSQLLSELTPANVSTEMQTIKGLCWATWLIRLTLVLG